MKYSREYLDQRSASTGFRPDTLEKVLRLLRLLDQVTRHPLLGSRLLLKGGTTATRSVKARSSRARCGTSSEATSTLLIGVELGAHLLRDSRDVETFAENSATALTALKVEARSP